jgi:hypothetical protein
MFWSSLSTVRDCPWQGRCFSRIRHSPPVRPIVPSPEVLVFVVDRDGRWMSTVPENFTLPTQRKLPWYLAPRHYAREADYPEGSCGFECLETPANAPPPRAPRAPQISLYEVLLTPSAAMGALCVKRIAVYGCIYSLALWGLITSATVKAGDTDDNAND